MHRIDDKQDATSGLLTFGHSHCKNVNIRAAEEEVENQIRFSSDLREIGRKECRYLRIRMLYEDESCFQLEE